MALSPRQSALYVYEADIWRKTSTDDDFPAYEQVYTALPMYLESSPDDAQPAPVGRSRHDMFVTLDHLHFEYGTVILDTDFVQITGGPAGPNVNGWWAIRGNVQTHGRRANKVVVIGAQSEEPPGFSA